MNIIKKIFLLSLCLSLYIFSSEPRYKTRFSPYGKPRFGGRFSPTEEKKAINDLDELLKYTPEAMLELDNYPAFKENVEGIIKDASQFKSAAIQNKIKQLQENLKKSETLIEGKTKLVSKEEQEIITDLNELLKYTPEAMLGLANYPAFKENAKNIIQKASQFKSAAIQNKIEQLHENLKTSETLMESKTKPVSKELTYTELTQYVPLIKGELNKKENLTKFMEDLLTYNPLILDQTSYERWISNANLIIKKSNNFPLDPEVQDLAQKLKDKLIKAQEKK